MYNVYMIVFFSWMNVTITNSKIRPETLKIFGGTYARFIYRQGVDILVDNLEKKLSFCVTVTHDIAIFCKLIRDIDRKKYFKYSIRLQVLPHIGVLSRKDENNQGNLNLNSIVTSGNA